MSRYFFIPAYIIMAISLLLGHCADHQAGPNDRSWAEMTLRQLSLREKIAQMMITYMNMRFINSESERWALLEEIITGDGVGGIHLWYGEAGTSLTMMNQMQSLSKVPILFDGDLERGLGQRFPGATHLPPLMALAATGNPHNAYDAGRITALEGRAVGMHFNLGPVVDLNNNPANPIINVRAFGEDPDQVVKFALAYLQGMQDNGMAGTAKHFPGHGDTDVDSHIDIPAISSDSTRLWQYELAPYKPLIDKGVDAVLTAHIRAPDYQPHSDTPATLSPFWISEILRGRLGFTGPVVTDALFMGAITANYSTAYALVATINAGADIIIQNVDIVGAIDIVEQAVQDGLIARERINEAALRMLQLKEKLNLHKNRFLDIESTRRILGREEFRNTAAAIAAESITLLKNDGELIPLRYGGESDTLFIIDLYDHPYDHSLSPVTQALIESGLPVKPFQLDDSDGAAAYEAVSAAIPTGGRVLVNTFVGFGVRKDRIFLPDIQRRFVQKLVEQTTKLIVASLGTPYLIQAFPQVPAYLCAYNSSPLMQAALTDALLGYRPIAGRVPVTIPGVAARGAGLQVEADSLVLPEGNRPNGGGDQVDMPAGTLAGADGGTRQAVKLKRVLAGELGIDATALEELVTKWESENRGGGELLIAKGGRIFYNRAFGDRREDRIQPVSRGAIYPLYNIGRAFNANLVLNPDSGGRLMESVGLTATYKSRPDHRKSRLIPTSGDVEPELYSSAHDIAILSQALLNGGSYRGEEIGDIGRIDGLLNNTVASRYWIRAGALPLPPSWKSAPIGQVDHTGSLVLIDPGQQLIVVSLVWSQGETVGQRRAALLEVVRAAIVQN